MANTQEMCDTGKRDLMDGTTSLGTDALSGALYLATATVDSTTTAYSATNEVTGTNYTAGGVTVTTATSPTLTSGTAHFTPSASIVYTNVTLSTAFDAILLYKSTGNNAVSVHTFGSQTVTAADFTLTMPTDDNTTGLIRLA